MDYLYSLYDALVGINVPNDRARAVVDAMERDMSTTIATKSDLRLLAADVELVRRDVDLLRREMATKTDLADLRQETALMRKDLEMLSSVMTVRLGSMLMLGLGLLFAALKLT